MELRGLRSWARGALLLIAVGALGCSGSHNSVVDPPDLQEEPSALPGAGLPQLPDDTGLPPLPRVVAAEENHQNGKDVVWRSALGANTSGDTLKLASPEDGYAWGIWRWGEFTGNILPLSLHVEGTLPGDSTFWLLLSNYGTQRWEILGQISQDDYSHIYAGGGNYISELGYSYVAVLVEGDDDYDVHGLNLIAEADINPPATPQGLYHDSPGSKSVRLHWTSNTDADLYRYNIYSGPEEDFDVHGDGAMLEGQAAGFENAYSISGLIPESTYFYRITALDLAGNESPPSNTTEVHTPPEIPLLRPYNLSVNNIGSSWADLSWQVEPSSGLLGYEVYTGPFPNFSITDEGVEKRNGGLITEPSWRVTDLFSETEYNIAVLAYYTTGKSGLSDSEAFTTLSSIPPVPDYTYDPAYVEAGIAVAFDPSATTDIDTPLTEIVFKWDFTSDGNIDETTVGPEIVDHIFPLRGQVTTTLTASDGTYRTESKEITVNMHYGYFEAAQGSGAKGSVSNVDTDPATSEIAVLVEADSSAIVEYFNGAIWYDTDASSLGADYYCDAALDGSRFSLLSAVAVGTQITWKIHSHDGSTWTETASEQVIADSFITARLDISHEGSAAVAVTTADSSGADTDYTLHVWHEQSAGTFSNDSTIISTNVILPQDVLRDDTTSRFVYCSSGQVHEWAFTDSGDNDTNYQEYAGIPLFLAIGEDPDTSSHVYWAVATDFNIYYGDNYGAANAAGQYIALSGSVNGLAGVGLTGDNEVLCCWTEAAVNDSDSQQLMNYDSTADDGAGATYEITNGYGLAGASRGGYYMGGTSTGIYAICDEVRDGECTGYFVTDGAAPSVSTIYTPQGAGSISEKHYSVLLADGSFLSLSGQEFATSRASWSGFPVENLDYKDYGVDNWAYPDTACTTRFAYEFLGGSYTSGGDLVLNKFSTSFHTGQLIGTYSGTSLAKLVHNAFSQETKLFYATDSATDIEVRQWNESNWSEPVTVMQGNVTLTALAVAGNMANEWGVAYIDENDTVWLVESLDEVWGQPLELSDDTLNAGAGIGFDYHTNGSSCVAVERNGGSPGIYLGVIPASGSISWELVSNTVGDSTSLYAFYHLDSPIVLYYKPDPTPADSRMQLVEEHDGVWTTTELPGQMHGAPVAASRNVLGNIVLTGYRIDAGQQSQAVAILYR